MILGFLASLFLIFCSCNQFELNLQWITLANLFPVSSTASPFSALFFLSFFVFFVGAVFSTCVALRF
jgi:hypothetical protein